MKDANVHGDQYVTVLNSGSETFKCRSKTETDGI